LDWEIEYTKKARKQIKKLSSQNQERIYKYFEERVSKNPYKCDVDTLKGSSFAGMLRFRIGNYRAICDIQDEKITVLVLEVRHRSEAYKKGLQIKLDVEETNELYIQIKSEVEEIDELYIQKNIDAMNDMFEKEYKPEVQIRELENKKKLK